MRRENQFRMPEPEALELLASAPTIHLATTSPEGEPILRTLNAVVVDGAVCFHGSPKGEKTEALGRRAVVSVEEVVAPIPSYFVDPERACPATTLYRSVQVHGVLEEVEAPDDKAKVLAALMTKLQPEGGHVPITADHPLYRAQVRGLLVVRLRPTSIDGKAKLAQNRTPEERTRLLERLWGRGAQGDPRAIELIAKANPDTPRPEFLQGPPGTKLHCQLFEADLDEAYALVANEYWNEGLAEHRLRNALKGATAWVGARSETGELIAQARALSDGGKTAWVYDVATKPEWRRKGVATALMKLLLDHPRVRDTRAVYLHTKDAQPLYRTLGFVERSRQPPKPYPSEELALFRPSKGGQ